VFWITEDVLLVCKHQLGKVSIVPSQDLVSIGSRRVLIDPDPQGRSIGGCPNYGPTMKPCTNTLQVERGYSEWVRIEGKSVCLDTVTGLTDGTLPGTVKYIVNEPGQHWVQER